ncbi:MAG TPA: hypothetical protein DCZ20_01780, partial [Lachnospiraceae bacterium]|nr:hypothetical protein [Lachnospiraceae bacterium]
KMIPFILGGAGIFLSALYVFSTCQCHTVQQMMLAVFTSITQGILIAGLSTYINQLFKQIGKTE